MERRETNVVFCAVKFCQITKQSDAAPESSLEGMTHILPLPSFSVRRVTFQT